jgi:hypothetical protein
LLGIGLDDLTPGLTNRVEDRCNGDASHTLSSERAPGEDAADSPGRKIRETGVIPSTVLDVRKLCRWSVLAPPHALVAGEDQLLMRRPVQYVGLLRCPVSATVRSGGRPST